MTYHKTYIVAATSWDVAPNNNSQHLCSQWGRDVDSLQLSQEKDGRPVGIVRLGIPLSSYHEGRFYQARVS